MTEILVTGAEGLIGRFTCSELARQGLEFVSVDRHRTDHAHVCDLIDRDSVSSLFQAHSFGTVIHLAAILPTAAAANPALATDVNVVAPLALMQAAMASGCRRFVFGSSMSVYGSARPAQPIAEDVPPAPTDIYGAAKWFVELAGSNLHEKQLLDFSALRIATVIGPGARNTSTPWRSEICEKLGTGVRQTIAIPHFPDDLLSLVHVEDVARMLVFMALRQDLPYRAYNTPIELWTASDLKRTIEEIDPNVKLELVGRERVLAPLANGKKFTEEFGFAMPELKSRLAALMENSATLGNSLLSRC